MVFIYFTFALFRIFKKFRPWFAVFVKVPVQITVPRDAEIKVEDDVMRRESNQTKAGHFDSTAVWSMDCISSYDGNHR